MENQLQKLVNRISGKISRLKPSEFAEQKRYMSIAETRWDGPFSFKRTPYLVEVLDNISPDSPISNIAVMKGGQIGFSTGVIENAITWVISEYPANMLLMCGDDQLVRLAMTQKIDPAIDSCGLRHLIKANQVEGKRRQRSGDKETEKEYPGGRLIARSVRSIQSLRQFSAKYLFLDDVDSGKSGDEKEGSLIKTADIRSNTFGKSAKKYYISTPVTEEKSIISKLFKKGDQRYYNVPCPECKKKQSLKWSVDIDKSIHKSGKAGIVYERDDKTGNLIPGSVFYRCENCGYDIPQKKKKWMMSRGEWVPTAKPITPDWRSYHISALYSPTGADNWEKLAHEWCECWPIDNNGKPLIHELMAFKMTRLGQTYKDKSRNINILKLAENCRSEYQPGIIPTQLSQEDGNGPIIAVTIGVDLNGTIDDARLDYLVIGWSYEGSSYAIDHGSIGSYYGRQTKPDDQREIMSYRNEARNSAWERFYETVVDRVWQFDNGNGGMKAIIATIDTGYHTVYAYEFLKRKTNGCVLIGVKGQEDNKFVPFDKDAPKFKVSSDRDNLYILQVNPIKDDLERRTKIRWVDRTQAQSHGFMNFPQMGNGKFDVNYFKHYAGEERKTKLNDDGTAIAARWVKKHSGSQNHFWDCEVYAIAARDIFVSMWAQMEGLKRATWHTFASSVIQK